MLMAGLAGIQNKIDPGAPADKNLYDLPTEEAKGFPTVAGSLDEALKSLDGNREFLKAGGVFDDDMIDAYMALKMEEHDAIRLRPHPMEYSLYYSC